MKIAEVVTAYSLEELAETLNKTYHPAQILKIDTFQEWVEQPDQFDTPSLLRNYSPILTYKAIVYFAR